ncbi:MAG: tRNA (adenosine(37)-N6)-threonylcarbamoyltransferase complex transferase subunit TsaD [Ignavibacteriae bacterium]|nr:tRNA (adenosine(37)-N6)-threonylcarbamoyltransferase complex transferase subunit TsaD [Ignavibacteriota bacterium]
MIILGIETSCDETSAAVLDGGTVKSNVISSQLVHARYGGVVPELASRAHQRMIIEVVDEALTKAGVTKNDLQSIAATQGPGLAGALLVGLCFGKAMAYGLQVPFVGINHMEGHLYSNFLTKEKPSYPFVSLIVSGGHSMLVHVKAPFEHRVLGQTRDDAAGEAFDKVAKMLGLGYPGGPVIDKLSVDGNPRAINFPRSYLNHDTFDFSFSGIKTAVLYYLKHQGLFDPDLGELSINQQHLADICASFQEAVVDVLVSKTLLAANELNVKVIALAGGVSANSSLRKRMKHETEKRHFKLFYPPLEYCMDNAAMIAYVGWMKLQRQIESGFDIPAVANLELT